MPDEDRYALTELADLAGVTPRTVRYYLANGLLPATGQSGPGVRYGPGHLGRLRLIRRLQAEHLPLAEIRGRLDALGEDDIRELAGLDAPPPPTDTALDYLRGVLGKASRAEIARPAAAAPALLRAITALPGDPGSPDPGPPVAGATIVTGRSQWERIVLGPDVELHVRRPLRRSQNKGIDRLVTIAKELLEEDAP